MSQTLTEKRANLRQLDLADLHSDHQLWLNTLRFCKVESGIFEKRMEDISRRTVKSTAEHSREVMAELEHFQNRYIREREVIDELRHDTKQHENHLEKFAMEHPVDVDDVLFRDHGELRDRLATFEKLYHELKVEVDALVGGSEVKVGPSIQRPDNVLAHIMLIEHIDRHQCSVALGAVGAVAR